MSELGDRGRPFDYMLVYEAVGAESPGHHKSTRAPWPARRITQSLTSQWEHYPNVPTPDESLVQCSVV